MERRHVGMKGKTGSPGAGAQEGISWPGLSVGRNQAAALGTHSLTLIRKWAEAVKATVRSVATLSVK